MKFWLTICVWFVVLGGIYAVTRKPSAPKKPLRLGEMQSRIQPSDKCVLFIFSDLQCPACKSFDKWLSEHPSRQLRIDFINFPLTSHPNARLFAEVTESLPENQRWATRHKFYEDPSFCRDVTSGKLAITKEAKKRVAEEMALSDRVGIDSTPSLIGWTQEKGFIELESSEQIELFMKFGKPRRGPG